MSHPPSSAPTGPGPYPPGPPFGPGGPQPPYGSPRQRKGGAGCIIAAVFAGLLAVLLIVAVIGVVWYVSAEGEPRGEEILVGNWRGGLPAADGYDEPMGTWQMNMNHSGSPESLQVWMNQIPGVVGRCTMEPKNITVTDNAMSFAFDFDDRSPCRIGGMVWISIDGSTPDTLQVEMESNELGENVWSNAEGPIHRVG